LLRPVLKKRGSTVSRDIGKYLQKGLRPDVLSDTIYCVRVQRRKYIGNDRFCSHLRIRIPVRDMHRQFPERADLQGTPGDQCSKRQVLLPTMP